MATIRCAPRLRLLTTLGLLTALLAAEAPAELPPVEDRLARLAMLEDTRTPHGLEVATYLADPEPRVRERAARALARLQDTTVVEALAGRLPGEERVRVRREIVFALGQIGHDAALPALVRVLEREADLEARALALEALGKIGGPEATPHCIRALADPESALRREAGIALWKIADTTAWKPLLTALHDPDPEVRWTIVHALEKIVLPHRVVPAVSERAGDESWQVRARVARTLGRQKAPEALGSLFDLLEDRDVRVRVDACRALGEIADTNAVPQLLARLADDHPHVRQVAVEALGAIGDPIALRPVVGLNLDRAAAVRAATGPAMVALAGPYPPLDLVQPLLFDRSEFVRASAVTALAGVEEEPEVVSTLRKILAGTRAGDAESGPRERGAAAEALGTLEAEEAVPDLVAALTDGRPIVVASAAEALGKIGVAEPRVIAALTRAVRENPSPNEPDIAVAGLEALAVLEAEEVVPLADELLASPVRPLRDAARDALSAVAGEEEASRRAGARAPAWKPKPVAEYRDLVPPERSAVIETARGRLVLRLHAEDSPLTVRNFVRLARDGYFDGLALHRVVPNFVIQDGDPSGTGWGGPGYAIRCEYNRHRYGVGTVGMALAGKDTGGSQWFVTHSPQPHLDGRYTVFAQVVDGLEVLHALHVDDEIVRVTVSAESARAGE